MILFRIVSFFRSIGCQHIYVLKKNSPLMKVYECTHCWKAMVMSDATITRESGEP